VDRLYPVPDLPRCADRPSPPAATAATVAANANARRRLPVRWYARRADRQAGRQPSKRVRVGRECTRYLSVWFPPLRQHFIARNTNDIFGGKRSEPATCACQPTHTNTPASHARLAKVRRRARMNIAERE
ncbi:Hypothetical predicted protein, partial [Olea europaea subsp. europaea]